jgi:hypothetical protein
MNASEKKTTETVLERARVREVTGVFHSRHALDAAAHALLLAGFDRADVDVVASLDQIRERIGAFYVAPEELADVPRTPRRPLIDREDIGVFKVVVASTLGSIAAGATVFLMMSSGAGNAETGVAAAFVGIVAAGAGFLLAARILGGDEAQGLDALMAKRGLILWVRARSPEQETLAQEILLAHGAQAVRVHEIEIEKRPDDLPLGSLRPNWSKEERMLGKPRDCPLDAAAAGG